MSDYFLTLIYPICNLMFTLALLLLSKTIQRTINEFRVECARQKMETSRLQNRVSNIEMHVEILMNNVYGFNIEKDTVSQPKED